MPVTHRHLPTAGCQLCSSDWQWSHKKRKWPSSVTLAVALSPGHDHISGGRCCWVCKADLFTAHLVHLTNAHLSNAHLYRSHPCEYGQLPLVCATIWGHLSRKSIGNSRLAARTMMPMVSDDSQRYSPMVSNALRWFTMLSVGSQ